MELVSCLLCINISTGRLDSDNLTGAAGLRPEPTVPRDSIRWQT